MYIDLPTLFEEYKQFYPDTYLFSKCLIEHLIISEIERKRNNGGYQYPIAIMRSSPIGPSAIEPLVGWVKIYFFFPFFFLIHLCLYNFFYFLLSLLG